MLAVGAAPIGDGFAIHAVNTACIATAFGADLQLDAATLREVVRIPRMSITDSAVKPIGHSTRSRSPAPW